METNYAKSAYRTFLFWGVCSSLGVTISTLVDATLVGNFIGSTGLAVANIATPVFLLYLLMGITLGGGAGEKTRRSRSERCKSGFRLRIKCRTDNRCAFRSCISRISQRIMQSAWCHTGAFATGTAVSERGVCLCPDLCVI